MMWEETREAVESGKLKKRGSSKGKGGQSSVLNDPQSSN